METFILAVIVAVILMLALVGASTLVLLVTFKSVDEDIEEQYKNDNGNGID